MKQSADEGFDQFRITYGEFRTKRLCLKAYDRFANDPAVVSAGVEMGSV